MLRQSTEPLDVSTEKRLKSLNGHSTALSEDGYGPEMDVDEQTRDGDDWDKMDTEEPENYKINSDGKYGLLLTQLIQYGQELKSEFKDDQSTQVTETFTDIFSMLAYQDPRKSPHGKMLDTDQRVPVAEALNSAILGDLSPHPGFQIQADVSPVSLGKSSSTALERLYKETSVLIDLISDEGGAGSFVNVRDIIRASRSWQ